MKLVTLIWVILALWGGMTAFAAEESHIIIHSTSHGPLTYTKEKIGVLKIGVTAFRPIIQLRVNNTEKSVPKDTQAEIEHTYSLVEGKNEFTVTVVTEGGRQQKSYIIHLGEKPKPAQPRLQMIGAIGLTALDNVTSVEPLDEKENGYKISGTFIPKFRFTSEGKSEAYIKAIVHREKFTNQDYESEEMAFTQILLQLVDKNFNLGEIRFEIGKNDVRTDNINPLLGADENVGEKLFSCMIIRKRNRVDNWNVKVEFKETDSKNIVTHEYLDSDAEITTVKGGLTKTYFGLNGTIKAGYRINNAKGRFKDSSGLNLGFKIKYPMRNWSATWAYDQKQDTMDVANPFLDNIKQEDIQTIVSVKIGYKIFESGLLIVDAKAGKQTSNLADANYRANITTASLVYSF